MIRAGYEPGPIQLRRPEHVAQSRPGRTPGLTKFRHEVEDAHRQGVAWRPFADVELSVPTGPAAAVVRDDGRAQPH